MIPARARKASLAFAELGKAAATSGSNHYRTSRGVARGILVARGAAEIIPWKNLVDINRIRFALTMWSLHVSLQSVQLSPAFTLVL